MNITDLRFLAVVGVLVVGCGSESGGTGGSSANAGGAGGTSGSGEAGGASEADGGGGAGDDTGGGSPGDTGVGGAHECGDACEPPSCDEDTCAEGESCWGCYIDGGSSDDLNYSCAVMDPSQMGGVYCTLQWGPAAAE